MEGLQPPPTQTPAALDSNSLLAPDTQIVAEDDVAGEGAIAPHWENPYQIGGTDLEEYHPHLLSGMIPFVGERTPARYRHKHLGLPLQSSSWLNRPFGAGWFVGSVDGAPLIQGHVNQGVGFFGGYRFTWDYDYYWGFETRVGAAAIGLYNADAWNIPRTSDMVQWDMELLYYPWGDSRIRPFFLAGTGISVFHFLTDENIILRQGLFTLPWGMGVKYRLNEYLVARLEVIDNWAFGNRDLDTMHNVSLTGGVEVRFGGVRRQYWPWNPSRHLW